DGMAETSAAMNYLDEAVVAARGIALRYGVFYGADNDGLIEPLRKRQFPIVGDGGGYASWIHLDDAAAATVLALQHDGPGVYHVVDDEPAPVREWLPVLAEALGAKPPRHLPVWLARLFAGDVAVMMGTETRGASNAKAKRELGWTLRHPSWRQGFAEIYGRPRTGAGEADGQGRLALRGQRARVARAEVDPLRELGLRSHVLGVDAQPAAHLLAAHLHQIGVGRGHQLVRPLGVRVNEDAALPARGDRHVAADQEREPAEHLLLGQAGLVSDQVADASRELLVVGHRRDGTPPP
ncbi:MAG TPA: NAD(P)-dependent oxidoreductase, partial [Gaiellaceae bacterium]|nr:NAD(P)-dependent oxidoreductase [Gaiellaceae bacterium]